MSFSWMQGCMNLRARQEESDPDLSGKQGEDV